ncbi:hypothetical protein DYD21_07115 [Rhodohalobacter sp. SW132]|uniref:hypothetical protein n=1 Tax=Rhodohalobacter sp. SW132 TaxID=2293433 RepID=UPI000E24FA0F|nr:hypothetical protein [Rhodohalobacter sp. SW132]REL37554.1 hypothetical protein DYD21_07115 [Rhodohalobacter sp. SW132]
MDKKGWLALLLILCCFLAGALHIQIDPEKIQRLKSPAQIDSLIAQTTYDFRISPDQIAIRTVTVDSVFSRKIYTIRVPPGFSKTTFHHHLHYRLYPLNAETYGTVQFPERDLNLQIVYNRTVHRTLFIVTDSELTTPHQIIPRLPD